MLLLTAAFGAAGALAPCGGAGGPASIVRVKERMQGSTLIVEFVCLEALYEDAFIEQVVARFAGDEARYPHFEQYRFRLSLIPEGSPAEDEAISVLFSYIFFDRDAQRTSDVEAFDFVMPRGHAGAIVAARSDARRRSLYEALREEQPELNPDFARRLPPRESRPGERSL